MFSLNKRLVAGLLVFAMIISNAGMSTLAVSISHYADWAKENAKDDSDIKHRYYEEYRYSYESKTTLLMNSEADTAAQGSAGDSAENPVANENETGISKEETDSSDFGVEKDKSENDKDNEDSETRPYDESEESVGETEESVGASSTSADQEEPEEDETETSTHETREYDEEFGPKQEESESEESVDESETRPYDESEESVGETEESVGETEESVGASSTSADAASASEADLASVSEADIATSSDVEEVEDLEMPLDKGIASASKMDKLFGVGAGDNVYFGMYPQSFAYDDENVDASSLVEPIEWVVLAQDNNKALLLSKKGLDKHKMLNSGQRYYYYIPGKTGARRDKPRYKESYMRLWLNTDFYDKAFAEPLRGSIVSMPCSEILDSEDIATTWEFIPAESVRIINNNPDFQYQYPIYEEDTDNVFLLSAEEFDTYVIAKSDLSKMKETIYSKSISRYNDNHWFTRSKLAGSTTDAGEFAHINAGGNIVTDMVDSTDERGVRAAIWVDKTSGYFSREEKSITWDLGGGEFISSSTWNSINTYRPGYALKLPTEEFFSKKPAEHRFVGFSINGSSQVVTEIPSSQTGNITIKALWEKEAFTFGFYPQSVKDATIGQEDSVVDPISWREIGQTDKGILYMAEDVLLHAPMNNTDKQNNYWANTDLRAWLNDTFYNTAFNEQERAALVDIEMKFRYNTLESYDDPPEYMTINDKVTIFNSELYLSTLPDINATYYANSNSSDSSSQIWLMDRSIERRYMVGDCSVENYDAEGNLISVGQIVKSGKTQSMGRGVVPIICIDKNSSYYLSKRSKIIFDLDGGNFLDKHTGSSSINPENNWNYYKYIEGRTNKLPNSGNIEKNIYISGTKKRLGFLGWRINNSNELVTEIPSTQTGDIKLTAVWGNKITWDLGEGNWRDKYKPALSYTPGEAMDLPSKDDIVAPKGKEFDYWTMNGFVYNKINADQTGDITLKAHYKLIEYNITYSFYEGGSFINNYTPPSKYIYSVGTELPSADKVIAPNGTVMIYWVDTLGKKVEYIDTTRTGDIVLKPKFQEVYESIYFGRWPQSIQYKSDGSAMNTLDPIKWKVINKDETSGKAMLLSEKILDNISYKSFNTITMETGYDAPNYTSLINSWKTTWKDSEIREWLNNNFFNKAFTVNEKTYIQTRQFYSDAVDNVSLLSYEEAEEYMSNLTRSAYSTKYSSSVPNEITHDNNTKTKTLIDNSLNPWWLINVESNGYTMKYVTNSGMYNTDYGNLATIGVRPVIILDLDFLNKYTQTITWDLNGGELLADSTWTDVEVYPQNFEFVLPKESNFKTKPTSSTGFVGFVVNDNEEVYEIMPSLDISAVTLKALWKFPLQYNLGDGSFSNSYEAKDYYISGINNALPTAEDIVAPQGKELSSWKIGNTTVTSIDKTKTGSITLVAVYKDAPYNITWDLGDDGEFINYTPAQTYTFGVGLTLPTKDKIKMLTDEKVFIHWTINGQKAKAISKTQSGDITIKAVYAIESFYLGQFAQTSAFTAKDRSIEPIKWIVIDVVDDKLLAVSEKLLLRRRFEDTGSTIDYKNSSISSYLKNNFYNNLFSSAEKSLLSDYDNRGQVFLLNDTEAADLLDNPEYVSPKLTHYSGSGSILDESSSVGQIEYDWFLMTRTDDNSKIKVVKPDKTIGSADFYAEMGIRPAILVDFNADYFKAKESNITWNLNGCSWLNDSSTWPDYTKYREGYSFKLPVDACIGNKLSSYATLKGWVINDGNEIYTEIPDTLTGDIKLTAKYNNASTVYFVWKNGEDIEILEQVDVVKYNYTKAIEVNKEGYTLEGWYKEDLTTAFNFNQSITEDTYIYAKLIENEYTITLNKNNGTYVSGYTAPTKRLYSQSVELPTSNDIVNGEYNFAGWYDNSNFDGDPVTSIPANIASDKEYWAKWTIEHKHKICGVSAGVACSHKDMSSHTDIVLYEALPDNLQNNAINQYINGTAGNLSEYIYLTTDISFDGGIITLTRDVYICLNGHSITGNFGASNYKVTITNCQDKVSYIQNTFSYSTTPSFSDLNAEIYGQEFNEEKNIVISAPRYIALTQSSKKSDFYVYNTVFSRINHDSATNNSYCILVNGSSSAKKNLTLEKVEFDGKSDQYVNTTLISVQGSGNNEDTLLNLRDIVIDGYKAYVKYIMHLVIGTITFNGDNIIKNCEPKEDNKNLILCDNGVMRFNSGTTTITENNIKQYSAIYLNENHRFEIASEATLNITKNIIKRYNAIEAFIRSKSNNFIVNGNLNITDNKFVSVTATSYTYPAAGIYLEANKKIKVGFWRYSNKRQ